MSGHEEVDVLCEAVDGVSLKGNNVGDEANNNLREFGHSDIDGDHEEALEGDLGDGDEDGSVIPSPEMIIKHPLQSSWTLWFYKGDKSKEGWQDRQKHVITFNTVEDFWALYNHIEKASKITQGCDYSLFKEGIKPMWEDKRNCHGGKWNIDLEKKHRSQCLDSFWLEIMLCLIGEFFEDYSPYVNGAVVALRMKGDKIGLWLSDSRASEAVNSIGKRLKDHLCIDPTVSLLFLTHEVSRARPGSSIKGSYKV